MGKQKRTDDKNRVLKKGETQRKDGTYMFRWTNRSGQGKTVYGKTLEELRKKEEEIRREQAMGIERSSISLNEQIERYLKTKRKLKKSTRENYEYYFRHSIKDSVIGKMRVSDIRKSDILLFYADMSDNGMAAGTIKILQKIIRPALQLAVDDGILLKNPADGCTKDYEDTMEKKYALTEEEETEFLDRILSRPKMKCYYPMYAIMLKTGIRISEMVGLQWEDVDMEGRTISINHQVQYRPLNGKSQYYAEESAKTDAGNRIIPMSDEVYKLFLEQRKVWLSTKKDPDFKVGKYKNFVFLSYVTGKCMHHNNVRRMMRRIVSFNSERKIQLPDVSPHILRHTTCTRLAETGCDIKVIQYILGQTDIRVTMRVYNHANFDRAKREIERLRLVDIRSLA